MTRLRDTSSETVGLAILDEKTPDGVIIGQVQGTQRFSFRLAQDQHFPLHAGAPGKAIVAFLPADRRNEMVKRMKFTRFNARTITSRKAFLREIDSIRLRGYATDVAEEVEGCHCVSAPVLDTKGIPVAAIWVTGPSSRFPVSMFKAIAPAVITAAENIAEGMHNRDGSHSSFAKHMVNEAARYIEDHRAENIEMEQLAKELHIGYSSFRHWFKTVKGTGPAQYHLKLRLDLAGKLLRSSNKSIAAVCREVGYDDQNYFSALFKKKTGLAPLIYRKKKRNRI